MEKYGAEIIQMKLNLDFCFRNLLPRKSKTGNF
jgi:hypothetical protein